MAKTPQVDIMRSPLGRARGLGAAKAGAVHWWMQRLTSLALVPLTLWFLCAMVRMIGSTRDEGSVIAFIGIPSAYRPSRSTDTMQASASRMHSAFTSRIEPMRSQSRVT